MFRYRHWQDTYEIHELADNAGNLIRLVPQRGGIVSEFTVEGNNIFYLDETTLSDENKNIRGGNPVLFPICGPLQEGVYQVGEKNYHMPQHGFARNLPWQIETISEGPAGSLTLALESSDRTRQMYPFDFRLEFVYEITPGALTIKQNYHNTGKESMPFYAGFHPYFAIGDKNRLVFNIAASKYYDLTLDRTFNYDGNLRIPEDREFNIIFSEVKGSEVAFTDRSRGIKFAVQFDEKFSYIVLWSVLGKPFLCFEPWMGNNNSLNSGEKLRKIQPGEQLQATVRYEISRV